MNTVDPAQTLEKLSEEYRGRAEAIRRDLGRSHSADFAEQASERQNDEVLAALLAESEEALRQVERARERLRDGSYGHCRQCGEAIGQARLAAMPMAEHCLKCAE
jgi:RNA polymerase-binding transcription factor DksA